MNYERQILNAERPPEYVLAVGGPKHGQLIMSNMTQFYIRESDFDPVQCQPLPTRRRSIGERLFSWPWRPFEKTEAIPVVEPPARFERYTMRAVVGQRCVIWVYVHESLSPNSKEDLHFVASFAEALWSEKYRRYVSLDDAVVNAGCGWLADKAIDAIKRRESPEKKSKGE